MPQPPSPKASLVLLSSLLTLGTIACSNLSSSRPSSPPVASSSTPAAIAALPVDPTPVIIQESPEPSPSPELDPYEVAVDRAASAASISASAQSQDDWQLVASQWQEAITLMKRVPNSSPYRVLAKDKIVDYQQQLSRAKKLAAKPNPSNDLAAGEAIALAPAPPIAQPAPAPRSNVATRPTQAAPTPERVFLAPIKRREGGTPVIDVVFNGNQTFEMIVDTGASGTLITQRMATALGVQPVTKALVDTASQKGVEIPVGFVDSIEVDGAVARNVSVAIAGPDLDLGLLGHDFFGNFDVTIRRDVVEFRVR